MTKEQELAYYNLDQVFGVAPEVLKMKDELLISVSDMSIEYQVWSLKEALLSAIRKQITYDSYKEKGQLELAKERGWI